jgi:hypothetical protein
MYVFPLIFFRISISYRSQVYCLPSSVEAIDNVSTSHITLIFLSTLSIYDYFYVEIMAQRHALLVNG